MGCSHAVAVVGGGWAVVTMAAVGGLAKRIESRRESEHSKKVRVSSAVTEHPPRVERRRPLSPSQSLPTLGRCHFLVCTTRGDAGLNFSTRSLC
jgi:hypothetical protein